MAGSSRQLGTGTVHAKSLQKNAQCHPTLVVAAARLAGSPGAGPAAGIKARAGPCLLKEGTVASTQGYTL
jgi:hypothetical protein